MTRPLRIGYVVPQFPGQTHIFFWREIAALEAMGHEVRVISTRKPPAALMSHLWSAQALARTHYLGAMHIGKALGGLARLIPRGLPMWMLREGPGFARDSAIVVSAAQDLLTLAAREKLDHIHVHSCARAALTAAFARRMGGAPYSLTLHGDLAVYGAGQRFKWSHAAFGTTITHTLLGEVQNALGDALPDRMLVQPMGIDVESLTRDGPYAPPQKGRPLQIFSCGRLNFAKGHQDLMTAVRQLIDQGVDIRVEIAGEDDSGGAGYRKTLEAHLKKLHLQDHVKLLGAIDSGQVRDKLQDAHLFVLASHYEALGVVYMEAMAMGVPVIGTDTGGVSELIEDGRTGLLVEAQAPAALARTIRDLSNDPDRLIRYGEAGRVHVTEQFQSARGAQTLATAIADTLADKTDAGAS